MATNVALAGVTPKELQSWSLGREAVAGTPVNPTVNLPLNSGTPGDHLTLLADHDLRGDMGLDYGLVAGTEIGSFQMAGDVYLDSIGAMLYNTFGDYTTTITSGSTASFTGFTTASLTVGATTFSGTGMPTTLGTGSAIQIQTVLTNPAVTYTEVVTLATTSTATLITLAQPLRFTHTAGTTTMVSVNTASLGTASFTHVFSLQNQYNASALGLGRTSQPVTHTVTHFNGLPANAQLNSTYSGYRQYPYFCSSGMQFNLDTNNLFQHNTSGSSFFGVDMTTSPSYTLSGIGGLPPAQANWQFAASVNGSFATTASQLQNIEQASISIARVLTPKYALVGQQVPVLIGRQDLSITGSLQFIATDESPLYAYINQALGNLNNTAAANANRLSIGMTVPTSNTAQNPQATNGLGISFEMAQVHFETATLADPDMMQYNVSFRALLNTTNAGVTGGRSPGQVTLVNNVPTY